MAVTAPLAPAAVAVARDIHIAVPVVPQERHGRFCRRRHDPNTSGRVGIALQEVGQLGLGGRRQAGQRERGRMAEQVIQAFSTERSPDVPSVRAMNGIQPIPGPSDAMSRMVARVPADR